MDETIQVYLSKADCHILANNEFSIYFIPSPTPLSPSQQDLTQTGLRIHSVILGNLGWS